MTSAAEAESFSSFERLQFYTKQQENKNDKEKVKPSCLIVQHGKSRRKKPLVKFTIQSVFWGLSLEEKALAAKLHLRYKFVKTECKIVRNILHQHCFKEVHPNSSDFNLMWTGSHLKPHTLRGLQDFQKVNHFPRSYELTRKDRLYQNIQKMQSSKGFKNFDFIPEAYVSPQEYNQFSASFAKQRGLWIVKPVASSRGRGIFLINHPNQIPLDDQLLVSKYISNPLLVDGFKFDLRLYVGVTSFDPLRIYLYEEGLTRFATVKYDKSNRNIKNSCMHLTNYSVNKKNDDYVSCNDPEVEDYGNKWSFGALLRFLKAKGIDTSCLVAKIEDLVVKTIISGEIAIATAVKMFVPHHGNCFEIYGFDVLIDENLKPWLLEVNLSPSMACDSPMDLKIKSNLLTDMFNMTGFIAQDPLLKNVASRHNIVPQVRNQYQRQRCQSAGLVSSRTLSNTSLNKSKPVVPDSERGLTSEELRALRATKEEFTRRGHYVRIFPSPTSRESHGSFLQHRTTNNRMLFARLFLDKSPPRINYDENDVPVISHSYVYGQTFEERLACYERQLPSLVSAQPQQVVQRKESLDITDDDKLSVQQSTLTQGELNDRHSELVFTDETSASPVITGTSAVMNHKSIHIEDVVSKAGSLSKLQARKAFAMYLRRVKERLLNEASSSVYEYSTDEDEKNKQDEQMSLVIRFLKKAARNLQQEFKVIIPNNKLPLHDRRRMLAQQLGDFVHIYDKETAQMKGSKDVIDEHDSIPDEDFRIFLTLASEIDLEDLLTRYTRANKNASIFLGNSPGCSQPSEDHTTSSKPPPAQRQMKTQKHLRIHSAHALTAPSNLNSETRRKTEQQRMQSIMSDHNKRLASAIAAYGKSLGVNKTKKRPASATVLTQRRRMSSASLTRPVSAKTSAADDRVSREKSVSDALKQLARRQAVRQYSARPPLKIEANKWMQPVENTDTSLDSGGESRVNASTRKVTSSTDRMNAYSHYPVTGTIRRTRSDGTSLDNENENNVYPTGSWMSTFGHRDTTMDNDSTTDVHDGTLFDTRQNNADDTFFSLVQNELQVSSKPTHARKNTPSKEKSQKFEIAMDEKNHSRISMDRECHSRTFIDKECPSRIIRIPCGEVNTDMADDTVGNVGSAREDYNKHMQLLIERLAAHKFEKPSTETIVPRPPARPRSVKRPVSVQRISRITTSHSSLS